MAIRGTNNNTGYLGFPFAITRQALTNTTILQWNRTDYVSGASSFWTIGAGFFSNTADYHLVTEHNNASLFPDERDNAGLEGNPFISVAHNPGVWVPQMWIARSDRTIDVWDSVSNVITNDGVVTAATTPFTHFGIGNVGAADAGGGAIFDGSIAVAEVAVWSTALTTTDFIALKTGANPLSVRRDKLMFYFPLRDNLRDYGPMGASLGPMGTNANITFTDNPPVQIIPRRRLLSLPAVSTISPSANVVMTHPW